jgi:hypothetical protein
MLNWNFVKANPITHRATDGAIRFEVTVGADKSQSDYGRNQNIPRSRKSVAVL